MARLFVRIPSFATDYSGAASTISDLGGLAVVHGPTGCIGNFTGYDETRWFSSPKAVFNSALRERDAIMGDDSAVIEALSDACAIHRPSFMAIIGTPVPNLIGCDLEGIAAEAEALTGIPAIGVGTNGYGFYQDGIEKAFAAVERRFPCKWAPEEGRANVLGFTYYDYDSPSAIAKTRDAVSNGGGTIGYFQTADGIERFRITGEAEMNIVVSSSMVNVAERIRKKHGTGYIAASPNSDIGVEAIRRFVAGEGPIATAEGRGHDVLIIGDQVVSNGVRDDIASEFGKGSDVATFFGLHRSLSCDGDVKLRSESGLMDLMKGYKTVVGDALFGGLAPPGMKFVPLAHVAVSGKFMAKETGMNGFHRRLKDAFS
jgi:hypothetical protein